MKKKLASGIAALSIAASVGVTGLAAAPALAAPSGTATQSAAHWAPTETQKLAIKQAVLDSLNRTPVVEETEETESDDTETDSPSFGSSSGSSSGSAELGPIIGDFLDNFDWAIVTVPLISRYLQAQGIPAVIATPLAQVIWGAIESVLPARAA
ncbi:hypothetical protein V1Y59_20040 [Gordonia sp. PKS22-38]|uniref:Secreted protein n=1 Tax=Gordonia prachuapensis TaxID=3115651 RepID=A0ABU7MYJ9_9ACTN|nr:hypothetical protein [Gordonia sp. PKS22-38]